MSNKDKAQKDIYWPGQVRRSRFLRKYNMKYGSSTKTRFSRRGYESQLYSALVFNRAIRYMFKIPDGEGRISNVDESMCYMYNTATKSWSV